MRLPWSGLCLGEIGVVETKRSKGGSLTAQWPRGEGRLLKIASAASWGATTASYILRIDAMGVEGR